MLTSGRSTASGDAPRVTREIASARVSLCAGDALDAVVSFLRFEGSVSTGEDVLKSGGVGTVKGTAGLLGLPGDAASLLNRGLNAVNDWLGPKLGYSPEEIAKTKANGSPLFPTSGDVQKGIGELFGPVLEAARLGREAKLSDLVTGEGGGFKFYEPQTTGGRYAESIGSMVPGAVLGPTRGDAPIVQFGCDAPQRRCAGGL